MIRRALFATAAAGLVAAAVSSSAQSAPPPTKTNNYQVHKQVADTDAAGAAVVDPDLVNPWGISAAPGGAWWISDNGTSKSTLYDRSTFSKMSLVVKIPAPGGGGGSPTGTVYSSFGAGAFRSSTFLFATEEGTIAGWYTGSNATTLVDNSAKGAVYKGLAIATVGGSPRLYAADFGLGKVEMYDASLNDVGDFTDPGLPANYSPFNVQALNGQIYVTYAKRHGRSLDEQDGPHLGYVDVFDTSGNLVKQLVAKDALNAPWGLAIAPSQFGAFSGDLLVGNFGDGRINAYDPVTGAFKGTLNGADKSVIKIDGLWGLTAATNATVLFTAGPNGEANGLMGTIEYSGPRRY